jgi:uncharacterized protein YjbI with pentapeptide repeats
VFGKKKKKNQVEVQISIFEQIQTQKFEILKEIRRIENIDLNRAQVIYDSWIQDLTQRLENQTFFENLLQDRTPRDFAHDAIRLVNSQADLKRNSASPKTDPSQSKNVKKDLPSESKHAESMSSETQPKIVAGNNFQMQSFSGRSLSKELWGEDYQNVSFFHCDLSGSKFSSGTVLEQPIFIGANLTNAEFENSIIVKGDFTGAKLDGASLVGTTFINTTFDECSAVGAVFDGADFQGCTFLRSSLKGAIFRSARVSTYLLMHDENPDLVLEALNSSSFTATYFAMMRESREVHSHFVHADLRNADFTKSTIWRVHFEGANLSSANLMNATIYQSTFGDAQIQGLNLTGAELIESVLAS